MEDNANGPVFRATKRRKVFRKRAESDASGDEPHVASTVQGPENATPADGTNSTSETQGDASSLSETTRVRRPKKHGIAFSSSDQNSSRPHNNEETALVISEEQPQDVQNGRFARQTGRTVVADDKHMSAYIDSKLAEMRSKTGATAALNSTTQSASQTPDTQEANMSQQPTFDPTEDAETAPLSPPPTNNTSTAHQSIAATATTNPKRRQPRRPRAPSPSTLARASLIDQIMRESNHTPHYTPPTTGTSSANPTSTAPEEELDPDAAAAAAFKADFLAQAEARNLSRRKPKAAATATSGGAAAAGAAVSSGPKLGGSRAARVRMRAAEEAKAKK